jgi:chemotaxis protein methyltransferase CheR
MLLREHFAVALAGWQVNIVATDLSAVALERARAGVYTQLEVNRGLPAAYLIRHFQREGITWRLKDDIRRMVTFRQLNLMGSWSLSGPPDLVFLRNVLYYFAAGDKKAILARMRRAMRPRGVLLVGSTENIASEDGFVATTAERAEVYRPL